MLGAESHGHRAKLLDEGRESEGLCPCQGWCQNSQADYKNDSPVFHGMPYLWKILCGAQYRKIFTLKIAGLLAVAGGKEAKVWMAASVLGSLQDGETFAYPRIRFSHTSWEWPTRYPLKKKDSLQSCTPLPF